MTYPRLQLFCQEMLHMPCIKERLHLVVYVDPVCSSSCSVNGLPIPSSFQHSPLIVRPLTLNWWCSCLARPSDACKLAAFNIYCILYSCLRAQPQGICCSVYDLSAAVVMHACTCRSCKCTLQSWQGVGSCMITS